MREYMNIFRGLNEINRHDINFKWILQSIGLVQHTSQAFSLCSTNGHADAMYGFRHQHGSGLGDAPAGVLQTPSAAGNQDRMNISTPSGILVSFVLRFHEVPLVIQLSSC